MSSGPAVQVESMVVVRVEDVIDPRLTGRSGGVYESPPQTREQAMALVWLLLGCAAEPGTGEEEWSTAVAGGRRTVTLTWPMGTRLE